MYDVSRLHELIELRNIPLLKQFMQDHGLVLKKNRIVPQRDLAELQKQALFWNQRQLAKKIILNATYGALLNEMMRLFDQRIGQSTTLSGRLMAKHMGSTINKIIVGIYDHTGAAIIYGDTDSVAGDSLIRTNYGTFSITELFERCSRNLHQQHGKEYVTDDGLRVMGYNREHSSSEMMPVNYIYRHRVSKTRYRITDSSGHSVVVTGDHSVMVERNQELREIKPSDMLIGDVLISIQS